MNDTPTPRTDAIYESDLPKWDDDDYVPVPVYIRMRKNAKDIERELAEAREQLNEWTTLCIWGGTPQHVHDFIKGQQERIHAAQDAEQQRDRLAESLKVIQTVATPPHHHRALIAIRDMAMQALAAVKGGTL